jgi:Cu/Ag efflux protein CusF
MSSWGILLPLPLKRFGIIHINVDQGYDQDDDDVMTALTGPLLPVRNAMAHVTPDRATGAHCLSPIPETQGAPMKLKHIAMIAILLTPFWVTTGVMAAQHGHSDHQHVTTTTEQVHQGYGIVESVDPATATIRMDHEPIESLRWPQMVMDLKVKDAELLTGLEPGDRIVFDLVQSETGFIITRIEKSD